MGNTKASNEITSEPTSTILRDMNVPAASSSTLAADLSPFLASKLPISSAQLSSEELSCSVPAGIASEEKQCWKQLRDLPLELWQQVFSHLPIRDLSLSVKPVCRTFRNEVKHLYGKLTNHHKASVDTILSILHRLDNEYGGQLYRQANSLRLVSKAFYQIIEQAPSAHLQRKLFRHQATSIILPSNSIIELHPHFERKTVPSFGWMNGFEDMLEEPIFYNGFGGTRGLKEDVTSPAVSTMILRFGSILQGTINSSHPSKPLCGRDIFLGLHGLMQQEIKKNDMIEFIKASVCDKTPLEEGHHKWCFNATGQGFGPEEDIVIIPGEATMDWVTHMIQCDWYNDDVYLEVGADGVVVMDWGRDVELHPNCRNHGGSTQIPPVIWLTEKEARRTPGMNNWCEEDEEEGETEKGDEGER